MSPAEPRQSVSVVVPAHNEEAVIERGLAFAGELEPGEATVVVVANGCTDGTAAAARQLPGSPDVVDLAVPSKPAALNAGDRAAGATFPRMYLDADVTVSATTVRALRDVLDAAAEPRVAAPRPRFVTTGRPWPVRAYYQVFQRLPYAREGLVGLGVYALNAAGRRRFGEFPDVLADDLLVQRLFEPHERLVLDDHTFAVETPRSLSALVAVRARVARGNAQLAATGDARLQSSATSTGRALLRLVAGRPWLAPAAAVYAAVGVAARRRARQRVTAWERDETTRAGRCPDRAAGSPSPAGGDPAWRVLVGDIAFDPVTEFEVAQRVTAALDAGRGGWIATANVDHLRKARDPQLATLFSGADVVTADGMPIVWLSRLLGHPLPDRVTGASLVWRLAEAASLTGRRLMLLGAAPGVADEAARRFRETFPGLGPVATYCPPEGFDRDPVETERAVAAVRDAAPDLVFVALGAPRQERLIRDVLLPELPGTWFIGCGGALTMAAGEVPRAPRWVQRSGLEWVHRLAREPRRLARRYLVEDAPVAVGLLASALAHRAAGRGAPLAAPVTVRGLAAAPRSAVPAQLAEGQAPGSPVGASGPSESPGSTPRAPGTAWPSGSLVAATDWQP